MNTRPITTRFTSRLAALAFSTVFTFALLVSVDQLAASATPGMQLAQSSTTQQG